MVEKENEACAEIEAGEVTIGLVFLLGKELSSVKFGDLSDMTSKPSAYTNG